MNIEIKKQYDLVDYEKSVDSMKVRVSQIINESKKLGRLLVFSPNHC